MFIRLSLCALGLQVFFLIPSSFAGVFSSHPDVVLCSVSSAANVQQLDTMVFYASARLKNQSILYKSLTSNPILVTIDVDGRVTAPNLKDCDGQNVEQLRKDKRAHDF